jgi:signal peptidase I
MPADAHPTLTLLMGQWPSTIFVPTILLLLVVLAMITRWWDQPARERGQTHARADAATVVSGAATAVSAEATEPAPGAFGSASPDASPDRAQRTSARGRSRRNTVLVVVALLLMALTPAFVARIYVIPTGSMERTLHGCPGCDNDRVLVDKLSYRFTAPSPGDVVVFALPDSWTSAELHTQHGSANPAVNGLRQLSSLLGVKSADTTTYIKRVIAIGGQTVTCCDERNRIVVDGKPVDEPYLYFLPDAGPPQQAPFGPVRVPEGNLWVMGDSRNDSVDSRAPGNGPIPVADVIGQARFIVWPFNRLGGIHDTTPQTP